MPEYQIISQAFLGLNEDDNPTALLEDELSMADNVWHFGNSLWTRPGLVRDPDDYDAQITTGGGIDTVQGLYEHRRYGSHPYTMTRVMLVVLNGNVYVADAGAGNILTKTGVAISAEAAPNQGPDRAWTFAQHGNIVFGAGGKDSDDMWYIDKPAASGTISRIQMFESDGATAVTPKIVHAKWNYVFAARFFQTGTTTLSTDLASDPLVVRYHDLGTDPSATTGASQDADNWPSGNTIGGTGVGGFAGDFSEYITGFGDYSDANGDFLVVGTNKRLYFVTQTGNSLAPFQIVDTIPNGLVGPFAFIPLGIEDGDAIFISRDGIHSVRQSQQHGNRANRYLSWKIRKTFDGLNRNRLHHASGAYWSTEGKVIIAVPEGANAQNTRLLCLNVAALGGEEIAAENAVWTKWQLAGDDGAGNFLEPAMVRSARDSNNEPFVYVGTYSGDVGVFKTTVYADLINTDTGGEASSGYRMHWRTKHRDFGIFGREKQLGTAWIKLQPAGNYSANMATVYDYEERGGQSIALALKPSASPAWGPTGSFFWTRDPWGTETLEITRREFTPQGSGETIAFDLSHGAFTTGTEQANEPIGVAQLSYEVGVIGRDKGTV